MDVLNDMVKKNKWNVVIANERKLSSEWGQFELFWIKTFEVFYLRKSMGTKSLCSFTQI